MGEGLISRFVEVYTVKAGGISEERGGVDGVATHQMFELSDDDLGAVIYQIFQDIVAHLRKFIETPLVTPDNDMTNCSLGTFSVMTKSLLGMVP